MRKKLEANFHYPSLPFPPLLFSCIEGTRGKFSGRTHPSCRYREEGGRCIKFSQVQRRSERGGKVGWEGGTGEFCGCFRRRQSLLLLLPPSLPLSFPLFSSDFDIPVTEPRPGQRGSSSVCLPARRSARRWARSLGETGTEKKWHR